MLIDFCKELSSEELGAPGTASQQQAATRRGEARPRCATHTCALALTGLVCCSYDLGVLSANSEAGYGAGVVELFRVRDLHKARRLIILLVGNEIDRITTWRYVNLLRCLNSCSPCRCSNPQNRRTLQIPEEMKFSTSKVRCAP